MRTLNLAVAVTAACALGCSGVGGDEPPPKGYFHTEGARIVDAHDNVVRLTGLSWFGFELESYALHGLDERSLGDLLDLVRSLGYNVIRVPFSNEFLRGHPAVGIDPSLNPSLTGLNGLELLDEFVRQAGRRDLRIVLDRHRPTAAGQSPLWYTDAISEAQWISDWQMLARRYAGDATVIGADLHNEPYGSATWGTDVTATDWRLAAERAGNAILNEAPNWLIVVEGIQTSGGFSYWWGGNLRAAGDALVELAIPDRVVYSTHDYPSSVSPQTWFNAPNYPANLPVLWHDTWGYLVDEGIAPVLVGEFGTKYETESDRIWLQNLVAYMQEHGESFMVWCLNADSSATHGLLFDDWTTVRTDKQAVIAPALAPPLE